jgi:hypothetical protein
MNFLFSVGDLVTLTTSTSSNMSMVMSMDIQDIDITNIKSPYTNIAKPVSMCRVYWLYTDGKIRPRGRFIDVYCHVEKCIKNEWQSYDVSYPQEWLRLIARVE